MKKLWLRFLLWLDDICPKHGPMDCDTEGHTYCKKCHFEEIDAYHAKRKRSLNEYQKLYN